MIPGEILYGEGPVTINAGKPVTAMVVVNTGDRPVQVGSHYHFAEANPALAFDRAAAHGLRLAVPFGRDREHALLRDPRFHAIVDDLRELLRRHAARVPIVTG